MFCVVIPGIFGGFLLGVRSAGGLAFFDWDNNEMLRRIEIQPKNVSLGFLVSQCMSSNG